MEQHSKLGGCCHTFKEGRFEFDTGLHYVGNMTAGRDIFRVMEQLTEGQLQWAPMDAAYDELIIADSEDFKRFKIYGGFNCWRKAMLEYFPEEKEAILKLENLFRETPMAELAFGSLKMAPRWLAKLFQHTKFMKPMSLYKYFFRKTAREVVSSFTSNVYLQACINYIWGDIGVSPANLPFFLCAGANEHYISNGAFYPKHGSAIIPYYLTKTILQNGGSFFTRAKVETILLRKAKADHLECYGVSVLSDKSREIVFTSDIVVSGVGFLNTFQRLIPRDITQKACPNAEWVLKRAKTSVSYVNMFVGFSGTSAELNLPARNEWVMTSTNFDEMIETWNGFSDAFEALEKCEIPLMFIGFPSAKDPNYDYNNGRGSTCVAIALVPYSWFEMWNDYPVGKRGDQYESLKSVFADKIWEMILKLHPNLEGKDEVRILGSPVTSNFYFNTEVGEMYGLDHGMQRFTIDFIKRARPESDVEHLQ